MKFENKGKWIKQINESIHRKNEDVKPLLIPIEPAEQRKKDDALTRDLCRWSNTIQGKDFKWIARQQYTGVNCSIDRKDIKKYGEPCISAFVRLDLPSYHMTGDKNYIQLELGLDRYAPSDKDCDKELKNTFVSTKADLRNLGFTDIKEVRSYGEDWLDGYMYFNTAEECINKWKKLAPIIVKGK